MGLVVVGFGVDGVTIMDELVGGGEWWCSGGVGRQIEVLGDENDVVPLRRRVFSSSLDGKHIKGNTVLQVIKSKMFDQLHDDDVVSLCCVGILQLVLLGIEGRCMVLDWILRLANNRDVWDKYPWGSYVWPTLYTQLKDANVKRWSSLYATQPIDEVDKKTYLIFKFTWAFKTWILESFRGRAEEYYTRHKCHPRVGHLPTESLTPDEIEARSGWWVSSRAFFDGRISMMKKGEYMYEKMSRFMEGMIVGSMRQAKPDPTIVSQHYGLSDFIGFQSNQKESSDEECSTSRSKDEGYAMAVRDFKKFFKRRDAATRIILLENVQNYRKIRTKERLSEFLGAIAVKKMMRRSKMKRVL
nr:phospholipase-like protein [Tanacetum cinerariifolium]